MMGCLVISSITGFFWRFVHSASAESWTAVLTLCTAIVLAITAVFVLRGLDDSRKTRHGQLVTDLSARWDSVRTAESMIQFSLQGPSQASALANRLFSGTEQPKEGDLELWMTLLRWPDLIETIGVLHDEGVLSTPIVYKMWGPQINVAWEGWSTSIALLRKLTNAPSTFLYFERLATAMVNAAAASVS